MLPGCQIWFRLAADPVPLNEQSPPLSATDLAVTARRIWQDVLAAEVHDDTNFFRLGGNSLAAVAITARIAEECGIRQRLRVIFDHPRFSDYLRQVEAYGGEAS